MNLIEADIILVFVLLLSHLLSKQFCGRLFIWCQNIQINFNEFFHEGLPHIKTNLGLTKINHANQSAISEIYLSITKKINKKVLRTLSVHQLLFSERKPSIN